jgi:hypothetical protein
MNAGSGESGGGTMLGSRVGLADLVEAARDRLLAPGDYERWMIIRFYRWLPGCSSVWDAEPKSASEIADDVLQLVHEDQFHWASKVSVLYPTEEAGPWEGEPAWHEFRDVVMLAERIDSFLCTLERGGPGAPLARDCRHHLDLLLVLADWCQDAGQPRAAAEARHLHSLACALSQR